MAATGFFSQRLPGSDWGKPTDRDTTGFDTEIIEFNGSLHIQMAPVDDAKGGTYLALFSKSEAKEFRDAFQAAMRRVGWE